MLPIELIAGGTMKARLFLFALFASILVLSSTPCVADDNLTAATSAATRWLALVDSGQYANSWEQAASFFKEKVTKAEWESALKRVRTPLGKMESREFNAAQYETKPPGAPEGKYFILQYRTKFAGGNEIETITPMLDKDGTWRVSGYYIKPAD